MTNERKGSILVAVQFLLLATIAFMPRFGDFVIPGLAYLIGKLLFIVGLFGMFWSFRSLGPSLTANPVPLEAGALVTTGAYAKVRHPIYLFLLVMTLGMTLSHGSLLRLVFWLLLVALLQYKMRWEETLLRAKYPTYSQYQNEVPALLPRVLPR
ncbi:MAG: isoprenylcysteine carboxylmethyltransferase family protein [Actinomycetes bacterium]